HCSIFASMPSIQYCLKVINTLSIILIDWCKLNVNTGSMTFSSNCPASDAIEIVWSFPTTWNATWFTTSQITGLIFPGIIDEPGCLAGKLISPNPALGPEDIKRKSLAIFDMFSIQIFSAEDTSV